MKKLEILLVEDKEEHLDSAKEIFSGPVKKRTIGVDYATNYEDAKNLLENKKYDGVLTDLFMPSSSHGGYVKGFTSRLCELQDCTNKVIIDFWGSNDYNNDAIKFSEGFNGWDNSSSPAGIFILEDAIQQDVGVIIYTDSYHHDNEMQALSFIQRDMKEYHKKLADTLKKNPTKISDLWIDTHPDFSSKKRKNWLPSAFFLIGKYESPNDIKIDFKDTYDVWETIRYASRYEFNSKKNKTILEEIPNAIDFLVDYGFDIKS